MHVGTCQAVATLAHVLRVTVHLGCGLAVAPLTAPKEESLILVPKSLILVLNMGAFWLK